MENKVEAGQEVICRVCYGNGFNRRPSYGFPHGTVTEVTEKGFKVKIQGTNVQYPYPHSAIGKTVYVREPDMGRTEEMQDYEAEMSRLGLEE